MSWCIYIDNQNDVDSFFFSWGNCGDVYGWLSRSKAKALYDLLFHLSSIEISFFF